MYRSVNGPDGMKLSKQTRATPVNADDAAGQLREALEFLGQQPPPDLGRYSPADVLRWAVAAWIPAVIPRSLSRPRA